MNASPRIAIILIGRNEGARLLACLESLPRDRGEIVYVDSGSMDGSIEAARAAGARVVELDTTIPFTAARARNAGAAALETAHDFLQFIDGDCALDPEWIDTATAFLATTPEAAVVCGRRRERFPEATLYNQLCDIEWNTPIGKTKACGGDAMMRSEAFEAVKGFDPELIAGEEPDLCVRLRAVGWEIWRIDAEMTLHDADMSRFSQFWRRSRRGGYAFAEGSARHGAPPERHWVSQTRKAVIWGLLIPGSAVLVGLIAGFSAFLLILLLYPLQVFRLGRKYGGSGFAWSRATLMTVGKLAEGQGVLEYYLNRLRGRRGRLIEYK